MSNKRNIQKREIAQAIAKREKLPLRSVTLVIDGVFEQISNAIISGQRVELRGFGSFRVSERKAKTWNHPKGRLVKLPAKQVVKFKSGQKLKKALVSRSES